MVVRALGAILVTLLLAGCTGDLGDAGAPASSGPTDGQHPEGSTGAVAVPAQASLDRIAGRMGLNLTQPLATRLAAAPDGPNCLTAKAVAHPLVRLNATLTWDAAHPGAAELQLVAYSIETDRTLATAAGAPPLRVELPAFEGEDGAWVTLAAQAPPEAPGSIEGLRLQLDYDYQVAEGGAPEPTQASCSVYPPWGFGLFPDG